MQRGQWCLQQLFQSTLPVWGATIYIKGDEITSIISIHAPRVGSDFLHFPFQFCAFIFQSTLPVWGATKEVLFLAGSYDISIHAPRVGSDGGKNIL